MTESIFEKRIRLVDEAVALQEPERVPIWVNYGSTPFALSNDGTTFKDSLYDYAKASEAIVRWHQEFQPDVQLANLISGPAEEIAETRVIDWPGRPGTAVADTSVYQFHEQEYMQPDEYAEMLGDFTGFLMRKFIPRAFPGLSGLSAMFNPAPTGYMYVGQMGGLYSPQALETYEKLIEIGKREQECQDASNALMGRLAQLGFPPMLTGVGLVPYDSLSNYFRGTLGIFNDLMECPENIERAVDMFADLQIANLQYFRFAPLPVKRVMFWMHKGMDGFMSPDQYERLYWRPFLKVVNALANMGVTPIIYTEGNYTQRIDQMHDLPERKCIVHFETVDLKHAKDTIGQQQCITGNFPIYLLEHGTVSAVVEEAKRQIDIGAAGGGFIFETNASMEVVKRENLETLYDTVRTYGKR